MKKIYLLVMLCSLVALKSSAQTKGQPTRLSVGAEFGLPVGNASGYYSVGLGGSLKVDIPIAPKFFFTGSAGYTSYLVKNSVKETLKSWGITNNSSTPVVPLKVGGKYFISPLFYGEAQVGAAIETDSGGSTSFAWSPGVGFLLPAGNGGVDLGIRYEGWSQHHSTFGQFGIRVAYSFNL
ncbi:outer membrane beta-barrel protein [Mucilaginibacter sp. RS28]|uniref:Outer membrane beta-barrel protein n=1 Tax=Mucilaginibacter straminoryzae TaxID=2932774 RepID=A0A9X1X1U0_9SPHI|nr:outer membrane beta-barrel protein [Mucilaginibacter straminoryzae]MCJ8208775.1 outer membrane beta-barrel protein [Mucilaginibacter straminoryzae]